MRQSLKIAAVCAALLTMIVPAAQPSLLQKADADTVELAKYKLSAATLKKVGVAAHAFVQALQNDPKFKGAIAAGRELEALENKDPRTPAEDRRIEELQKQVDEAEKQVQALVGSDDKDDSATVSDMARKLAAIPHMSEAFKSAGLMLENSIFEITADANIERAPRLVRHNVNKKTFCHLGCIKLDRPHEAGDDVCIIGIGNPAIPAPAPPGAPIPAHRSASAPCRPALLPWRGRHTGLQCAPWWTAD